MSSIRELDSQISYWKKVVESGAEDRDDLSEAKRELEALLSDFREVKKRVEAVVEGQYMWHGETQKEYYKNCSNVLKEGSYPHGEEEIKSAIDQIQVDIKAKGKEISLANSMIKAKKKEKYLKLIADSLSSE